MTVDAMLRSISHPFVYGAGDAVAPPGRTPIRMACATALPLGAHAADNVAREQTGRTLKAFRFGYALRCISLGRHDGLIQWVDPYDVPKERMLKGRTAAWVKEQICRSTVRVIRLERMGVSYFRPVRN